MALKRMTALDEFEEKKNDVRKRMAKNFICFACHKNILYFIYGGEDSGKMINNENFTVLVTGGSSGDIDEGFRNVRSVMSQLGSSFDGRDVHATMVRDAMSEYLKFNLEDSDTARGFAVDFAMYDTLFKKLTLLYFTGDSHIIPMDEFEERIFVAGAYDMVFRKKLTSTFLRLLKGLKDSKMESLEKLKNGLIKKLGIAHCSILILE